MCKFSRSQYMAFIPGILALFALGMSVMSNLWCETVRFEPLLGDGDNLALPTRTFGPWYQKMTVLSELTVPGGDGYYVISEQCVQYPDGFSKDSKLRTAQAFSIIVAIIGGVMTFWVLLFPCFNHQSEQFWKLGGVLFLLCSLFQGLTLLFLDSVVCNNNTAIDEPDLYQETCSMDWGTNVGIAAIVFFFVAGIVMFIIPTPAPLDAPPAETQTVTYQQNADGTVKETGVVKGTYVAGTTAEEETPAKEEP